MSKARIESQKRIAPQLVQSDGTKVSSLLNAADLENPSELLVYSSYNIHPAPILCDVQMSGQFWQLGDDTFLPVKMRYGVEKL